MRAIYVIPTSEGGAFDQLWRLRVEDIVRTLRGLGVEVMLQDVTTLAEMTTDTFREIRALRPQFVSAPNLNYLLLAQPRNTTLMDLFEIPAVALWDDPFGALSLVLTSRLGGLLGEPNAAADCDALSEFRGIMRHPLLVHAAWDSGQIAIAQQLGLVDPGRVHWYPSWTFRAFAEHLPAAGDDESGIDVAFCGNIYPGIVARSGFWADPFFRALTRRICASKLADLRVPVWTLLNEELSRLEAGSDLAERLDQSRNTFWDYYVFLVWHAVNTFSRVNLLTRIEHEVVLFGLFNDPSSQAALGSHPNLRFGGYRHFFDELPDTFASTRVNVCIDNGIVVSGVPTKFVGCIASGGFALTDWKSDLISFLGPAVEAVLFRNADELRTKVEYFLARPQARQEVIAAIQPRVRGECTMERLYERVLDWLTQPTAAPAPESPPTTSRRQ